MESRWCLADQRRLRPHQDRWAPRLSRCWRAQQGSDHRRHLLPMPADQQHGRRGGPRQAPSWSEMRAAAGPGTDSRSRPQAADCDKTWNAGPEPGTHNRDSDSEHSKWSHTCFSSAMSTAIWGLFDLRNSISTFEILPSRHFWSNALIYLRTAAHWHHTPTRNASTPWRRARWPRTHNRSNVVPVLSNLEHHVPNGRQDGHVAPDNGNGSK